MTVHADTILAELVDRSLAPDQIEELARQRLESDYPQAFYFREVSFRYAEGTLTLLGRVPTSRMREMLWTLLDDLKGVERIDNQVYVLNATGLSDTRPNDHSR
jgi:hypothetical protein